MAVPGERLDRGIYLLKSGHYFARIRVFGRDATKTFDNLKSAKGWLEEMKFNSRRAPEGLSYSQNQWVATVEVDGRVIEKRLYEFDGAASWLKLTQSRISLGLQVDPEKYEMDFRGYSAGWSGPQGLAGPRTRADYAYLLKKYLLPTFGDLRVSEISTSNVRAWLASMERQGMGQSTIRKSFMLLQQIMSAAHVENYTDKDVCAGLKNPKLNRKKARALEQHELEALLANAGDISLMVEVGYLTGVRPSELRALRAKDFNFLTKEVVVAHAWKTDKVTWTLGPTKTGVERTIPIHESLAERLEEALRDLDPSEFIFTNESGSVISDDNYRRLLKRAARAAGVSWATPYTLRHTFASHMIAKVGAPINAVSYLMGHKSPTETLNTYVHFFPSDSSSWLNKLKPISATQSEQIRNELEETEDQRFLISPRRPAKPGMTRHRASGPRRARTDDPRIKSPLSESDATDLDS
jgi:integrase